MTSCHSNPATTLSFHLTIRYSRSFTGPNPSLYITQELGRITQGAFLSGYPPVDYFKGLGPLLSSHWASLGNLMGLPKCSLPQPITQSSYHSVQASHHSEHNLIAISHSFTPMLLVTQSPSCYSSQVLALINRYTLLLLLGSAFVPPR
jgi:hypothetical protein